MADTESLTAKAVQQQQQQPRKRPLAPLWDRMWPTVTMLVVVVAALWIASLFFPEFIFPGPVKIGEAVIELLTEDFGAVATTLRRYFVAMGLAALAGWIVGLLMGAFRRTFGRIMRPFISVIQAIPALSWILLVVLWVSEVEMRIGFVTFIIAFPFFVIAVYEGLRDMDKDMLEAIEQFRPTRLQVLSKVLVPQSVVSMITVLRSTAAMTLKIMIFAELIGANDGIGQRLGVAQTGFRIDLIFGWTVILVVTNFVFIALIDLLEKKTLKWRSEAVVR